MPYYCLEAQDLDEENSLIDVDPCEIEFESRTGNPVVDKLLRDVEKRPIF